MSKLLKHPNEVARLAMQSPVYVRMEQHAQQLKLAPQADCPLTHEFVGLFYIRTIRVPAGTLVVSKIFKADFPFFIVKGRVTVGTEHEGVRELEGPYWGHTKAGSRRMIMHHTEVIWTTFHFVGEMRNIDDIEREIIYTPEEN